LVIYKDFYYSITSGFTGLDSAAFFAKLSTDLPVWLFGKRNEKEAGVGPF